MTSSESPTGTGQGAGPEAGERLETAAQGLASDVRHEARHQAESAYRRGAESATAAAHSTAHAFDRTASDLSAEGHETLAQAASFMSSRLSSLANQLENRSLDELMGEARRVGQERPALFVAGGLALGFALSRFFRASTPMDDTVDNTSGNTPGPTYGTEAATPEAGRVSHGRAPAGPSESAGPAPSSMKGG